MAAGKTLIGGTAYSIVGGKTLIGGTAKRVAKGKTLIGGTAKTIYLSDYTVAQEGSYGFSIGSVTNPNSTLYNGVYQSGNHNVNSSNAIAKISFSGYDNFVVYIRSYAEKNYDYIIASTLDAASAPTAYNGATAKAHTRGNQKSGTTIDDYTKVEYANDGKEHFIYIVFHKDSSTHSYDDRGYFLIQRY